VSRPRPLNVAAALVAATVLASALAAGCLPHRSLGEQVWRDRCAKCHGLDGAGNTPRYMGTVEADLLDDTWVHGSDSSAIESVIRDGVLGSMSPFEMLTDQEVRAVIDYLRELRGEATG
jgi:mono/diheme cytochrome c family protein